MIPVAGMPLMAEAGGRAGANGGNPSEPTPIISTDANCAALSGRKSVTSPLTILQSAVIPQRPKKTSVKYIKPTLRREDEEQERNRERIHRENTWNDSC